MNILLIGLGISAAAVGTRILLQGWKNPAAKQALAYGARLKAEGLNLKPTPNPWTSKVKSQYQGPFESKMTPREAYLILGLKPGAPADKVKEAHRKIMVLNHPDNGGSTFLASKVNEAKDLLLKSKT